MDCNELKIENNNIDNDSCDNCISLCLEEDTSNECGCEELKCQTELDGSTGNTLNEPTKENNTETANMINQQFGNNEQEQEKNEINKNNQYGTMCDCEKNKKDEMHSQNLLNECVNKIKQLEDEIVQKDINYKNLINNLEMELMKCKGDNRLNKRNNEDTSELSVCKKNTDLFHDLIREQQLKKRKKILPWIGSCKSNDIDDETMEISFHNDDLSTISGSLFENVWKNKNDSCSLNGSVFNGPFFP